MKENRQRIMDKKIKEHEMNLAQIAKMSNK
jgi:hypothetical protein